MRPQRIFLIAIVCLAMPVLYGLATVAFTDAGMKRFTAGLVGNIRWLGLSPDGIRVLTFAMLVIGIVGVVAMIKAVMISCGGLGVWGWTQVILGTALLAGGVFGWHVGHIHLLWALGMGWGACILISYGRNNIRLGKWFQLFSS